jgi:hypothetical protein
MALARTQIKKKVAPKTSKKSPKKKTSRTSSSLSKLFSISKEKPKKNFSTSFEYGNLMIDINSNVTGNISKINLKITSKNFNFSGVMTLNEKAFSELESLFDHLKANVRKIR